MHADFWHERWRDGQIGFHEGKPNALFVAHLAALGLELGARVFLPLCGKTRDIGWLLGQRYRVAGAELSEIAIGQLFDDLGVTPEVADLGALKHYRAPGLDMFVGDVFELGAETLGPVDAVLDRAAFVALPVDLRARYARHIISISAAAPQLLVTFDYDQSVMPGPPFSIPADEVPACYSATHTITHLAGVPVAGKLKGQVDAIENIWHLVPTG